jgi:APA family basic amino acid/polyamine antiporter
MTAASTGDDARRLGLPSAAALVVASMMGAGVFTTSGFALAALGSPGLVLLGWVFGGAVAVCGALSYGALARCVPGSGGEYAYLAATWHPLAGAVAGWVSLLAGFAGPIAASALALEAYSVELLGPPPVTGGVAALAVLAAAAMHGVRLRAGVALQNVAVAAKLLLAAGFAAFAASAAPPGALAAVWDPRGGDARALPLALTWIAFAYSGWNAAAYLGGEVRDADRQLPRALVLGTVVVAALYVALTAVLLAAAPADSLAGRADFAAVAARALGGERLGRAVAGLVALALFTSISSMMMAGPRVLARMAQDGFVPRRLARVADVPHGAVAAQTLAALALIALSPLAMLLAWLGFALGVCSCAAVAGLVVLRRRAGARAVPIPGYPWVPGIFLAATTGTAVLAAVREPRLLLGSVALGVVSLALAAAAPLLHRSSESATDTPLRKSA